MGAAWRAVVHQVSAAGAFAPQRVRPRRQHMGLRSRSPGRGLNLAMRQAHMSGVKPPSCESAPQAHQNTTAPQSAALAVPRGRRTPSSQWRKHACVCVWLEETSAWPIGARPHGPCNGGGARLRRPGGGRSLACSRRAAIAPGCGGVARSQTRDGPGAEAGATEDLVEIGAGLGKARTHEVALTLGTRSGDDGEAGTDEVLAATCDIANTCVASMTAPVLIHRATLLVHCPRSVLGFPPGAQFSATPWAALGVCVSMPCVCRVGGRLVGPGGGGARFRASRVAPLAARARRLRACPPPPPAPLRSWFPVRGRGFHPSSPLLCAATDPRDGVLAIAVPPCAHRQRPSHLRSLPRSRRRDWTGRPARGRRSAADVGD